jgi:hypothetical protein
MAESDGEKEWSNPREGIAMMLMTVAALLFRGSFAQANDVAVSKPPTAPSPG